MFTGGIDQIDKKPQEIQSESGSTQDTIASTEISNGMDQLDALDQAILKQRDGNENPQEVAPQKRQKVETTKAPEPKATFPGDSHVIDRWCMNHGEVAQAQRSQSGENQVESQCRDTIETAEEQQDEGPTHPLIHPKINCGILPEDILGEKILVWDWKEGTIIPITCQKTAQEESF